MTLLVIGQRTPLQTLTPARVLTLEVQAGPSTRHHLVLKTESQPALPSGLHPAGAFTVAGLQGTHQLDLRQLPQHCKVAVVIEHPAGLKTLGPSHFRIWVDGQVVAELSFSGQQFSAEKTAILAEVYFKNEWRIVALCQGFSDLLPAALKVYGGTVAPVQALPVPAAVHDIVTNSSGGKIRLSKLTLEKQGSSGTIELSKSSPLQPININLKWSGQAKPGLGNLFGLMASAPDLDLGCLVEMQNGDSLVIQALGGYFGNRYQSPHILLDKDDRSGNALDGENLTVYQPANIKRMLVYAFIYQGAATFADVNARVTLKDHAGNEILIPLNQPRAERFCALALIERQGQSVRITKEEHYFRGHEACDTPLPFWFQLDHRQQRLILSTKSILQGAKHGHSTSKRRQHQPEQRSPRPAPGAEWAWAGTPVPPKGRILTWTPWPCWSRKMATSRSDERPDFLQQPLARQSGAVEHTGDNRTGEGDGDDESVLIMNSPGARPHSTGR